MVLRLVVQLNDRSLRLPLAPGEHELGSSPECALRIGHPTVSRRHAILAVGDGTATVTDLGSSNGTRVDGARVQGSTAVVPGARLRFGSVEARLEEVGEDELAAGIVLDASPVRHVDATRSETPPSTVGTAFLEAFSLGHLPDLVERLVRGESREEMARAVGAALLQSLPCRRVEVVSTGGEREGVLFVGERERSDPTTDVTVSAGDDISLTVAFPGAAIANTFQPLLRTAVALIGTAGRHRPAPGARTAPAGEPPRPPDPPSLVAEVREIYRKAARVAPSKVSVLIRGESGTGKELLARYLHAASERADRQLVTLNCAALPRDLLESELFGVERGVATGVDARAGKFESAHGGTLFLDEIGDMTPETQARILRVLAEGEVYRIGGHEARPADVRVISATNRDLPAMLASGAFRADLFHRIADWVVEVPPLRERRADIPNLAAHFLGRACAARGVRAAGISRAAVAALAAYSWPGNVRQLEREMGRAALFLDDGELLETSQLQDEISGAAGDADERLKSVLECAERTHVERVLAACGRDVPTAAERLGIGVSTLYRRLKALGIE